MFIIACKDDRNTVIQTVILFNEDTSEIWAVERYHYIHPKDFDHWRERGWRVLMIAPSICPENTMPNFEKRVWEAR